MPSTLDVRVVTPDQVRRAVARMLEIDPVHLDPERSLACYGLDSLSAAELLANLEDAFGQRLPDWLLADHPTLAALSDALCGTHTAAHDELAIMRRDCELPDDISPDPRRSTVECPRHVLLTGATGFLGGYLLRELLKDRGVHVTCLVRSPTGDGFARVRHNLESCGLWQPDFSSRIDIASGDLALRALGLGVNQYKALAHSIDAIYHAGADVNWVLPYGALRETNVLGTTELIRLACRDRAKQFHFISSLSVCYATDGPASVSEDANMRPYLEHLPLGYAQSKCVAETLVRQAAARGLQTRIYRPSLIAGDARTGRSNVDDLMAGLLKGCIQMGAAPDLDWPFDAVPVDYAARAIVCFARRASPAIETIHLAHPRPRHWRECILWANFFGYAMRLEPYPLWCERLEREARHRDHALHRLRPFFLRRAVTDRSVAELYEERTRSVVVDRRSRVLHCAAGIDYPALDADLLDRYFQNYITRRFLAEPSRGRPPLPAPMNTRAEAGDAADRIGSEIEPILQKHYADQRLRVRHARLVRAGSDHSVIGELMSWRLGGRVGLCHYQLDLNGRTAPSSLDVMVKAKPADDEVLDAGETIADVCDGRIATELRRYREQIGIRGSHLRELAIYDLCDERYHAHLPVCYGTWRRDEDSTWGLVLERLDNTVLIDASDKVWTNAHIKIAIDGLATLHGVWLGRDRELCGQPWMGHVPTAQSVGDMSALWQSLADHAAPRVEEWAGATAVRAHRHLASTVSCWWPAREETARTLIHNDFNSRNIALRKTSDGPRLVAYDWELATVGAPQRDLAELLCFVLPADTTAESLAAWVEHHRTRLEHASGTRLPSGPWRAGFVSALAEFLVTRLSFYALIDRVRRQPFLPRVVRTWHRLHQHTLDWESEVGRV